MRKIKPIILFLFLSLLLSTAAYSQHVYTLKNHKLSKQDFKKFITNRVTDNPASILVTPTTSKYPISNFITDIIVSGDTVWFATGSGIMRTIDNFNSFQGYYGVAPFGEDDIAGLSVNGRIVAASTAISEEISGENVPTGTGIKISTDYGANWESYPQPLDGLGDSSITYGSNVLTALPVVVRQQNLSYDIEITRTEGDPSNYTIWITSFAGGLRKSTDYGASWQRVLLPPDNLDSIYISGTGYTFALDPRDNLNHRAFTVSAMNDSTIFVGTADGINRSTDWGKSWRKYNFQNTGSGNNGVAGNFVVNLHVQRMPGNNVIWGATRRAEDNNEKNALTYSSDGGFTWSYTLDDKTPNGISSRDSITYGLTEEGLWRAEFGAFDWSKPGLIVDEETKDVLRTEKFYSGNYIGDTVYFGSSDALVRTRELGQPWNQKWKIFRAITPIDLASDIKTYAAPNPFAPDDEVTRIFFKTGKSSAKITIKIFDFGMNPVRTVIQNAQRNSADELFTQWDGKNDNGNLVANGVYFYRVEVDDADAEWGKILVLQ